MFEFLNKYEAKLPEDELISDGTTFLIGDTGNWCEFLWDKIPAREYSQAPSGWFDVAKLAPKLKGLNAIYHAHSAGYGFNLPASVPIITVSRNTLGYWGQRSPHSLIYYLPNEISNKFQDQHRDRDIDVLVQARKSSSYLMNQINV
jgi:hypothetical protein